MKKRVADFRVYTLRLLFFLFPLISISFAADPKLIVIWGLGIGPDSKGDQAIIQEFERRNPQYRVRALSMGAGNMNPQKLMTSIVGNVAPDVINQDRFSISDWASRGAFRPLDDLIARDRVSDPECPVPEKYYPEAWKEAMYEGKVYGIPVGVDDRVLYFNKEHFRKHADELRAAGLDANRPPRTWSETLKYAKILTEFNPDNTIKIAGFLPNYGNSWLYLYSFQMNGSFISADGRTCTMDTPENEKALQFMVDGYKEVGGYGKCQVFQSGFQTGENDPFILGKVSMKIDGDWIINDLSRYGPKLDFGVAPAPVPDDRYLKRGAFAKEKDQFVTWFGGYSYAIPNGSRNVEGAWAFIKFALSEEGRKIGYDAQSEFERQRGRVFVPRLQGQIPFNEKLLVYYRPADDKIAAALEMHISMMKFARFRPPTFAAQLLWDEHVRAADNAFLGQMTPKQALGAGQKTVQRELDAVLRMPSLPKVDLKIPVFVGIVLVALALIAAFVSFKRLRLGRLDSNEAKWAYILVSPWAIGFFVFTLGPMLASLFFSLTHYNVLNEAHWAGLDNYRDLFYNDRELVFKAFSNVLVLGGVGVPLGILTGLSVALILNSAVRGMRFYRTLFYMPAIVPTVASAVLWAWILAGDPNKGLINAFWQNTLGAWLHVEPPGWLTAPEWTKPALIIQGLWGAGSGMLLWLAGLKGIPNQLYEAASIDGATSTKQLFSITLPQLSPIIFFNCVMGLIGAMQEFDRVYVMASGNAGPADSLLMPVMHLFNNGFKYFKMGYASALAWLIFAIILLLTFVQFRFAKRWVHYEVDK